VNCAALLLTAGAGSGGAGYEGQQPPYDAFTGARYAVVLDPDGNAVGLMGPIDPAKSSIPEAPD
jgi:hypothetical protein